MNTYTFPITGTGEVITIVAKNFQEARDRLNELIGINKLKS
jgi:hypothetical protein